MPISLSASDGKPAPFASEAELRSMDGTLLSSAMIADKGRVFLTGVPDQAQLVVNVNGQPWCSKTLNLNDYNLPETGIGQLKVSCDAPLTSSNDTQGKPDA